MGSHHLAGMDERVFSHRTRLGKSRLVTILVSTPTQVLTHILVGSVAHLLQSGSRARAPRKVRRNLWIINVDVRRGTKGIWNGIMYLREIYKPAPS